MKDAHHPQIRELHIGLVGPLPPPSGGMANQTRQLIRLLSEEGVRVDLVQVNTPYRPAWIEKIKGIRALFRLFPYLWKLWRVAGRVQLVHIMANSGWSWHLFAAPAVWIARLRGTPVIVNYRGGEADEFFARSFIWVRPTLNITDLVLVPSGFLEEVFAKRNISTRIVPNIIDLSRFKNNARQADNDAPHLIVTRNLEPIYDIPMALKAFAILYQEYPKARLTIAGSGPLENDLKQLSGELGIIQAVHFSGRLDNDQIHQLYTSADLMLNPSTADNMPISILEALASGVPVVSTDVGGIPFLVKDEKTAMLVSSGDAEAMARAALKVLGDEQLAMALNKTGAEMVKQFAWPSVQEQLLTAYYDSITAQRAAEVIR